MYFSFCCSVCILRKPRLETRSRPKSGSQFISKYVATASGTTWVFQHLTHFVLSLRGLKLKLRRKRSNPGPNAWKLFMQPLSRNAAAQAGNQLGNYIFCLFLESKHQQLSCSLACIIIGNRT